MKHLRFYLTFTLLLCWVAIVLCFSVAMAITQEAPIALGAVVMSWMSCNMMAKFLSKLFI